MKRENRIREYLELMDLGDELYEMEKRRVTRKTTWHTKSSLSKEVMTFVETETIDFS